MAMVGLVWVLAVLGALFMAMSAQGRRLYDAAGQHTHSAGLVLTLLVLGAGTAVLVVGALRGGSASDPAYAVDDDPVPDLSAALGLPTLG
jgi:hypothetical protein